MRAVLLVAAGALLMTASLPATAPEAPSSTLAQALAWWPDGAPHADHAVVPETFGFGFSGLPNLGWPFCDAVSIFAYAYGPIEVHHGPALPLPVSNGPVCGGFHGSAETYADVTFDFTAQAPLLACVAAQVMVDPETPVGLLGGYDCSWDIACFSGQGALYAADYFGLRFVYVLGYFGTVVAGEQGVDLTGCVPGLVPPAV